MARTTFVRLVSVALVLGWVGPALAQDDVADIPSRQFSVAGDPNLNYFVIGPVAKEAPPDGYGLVVVLPGGDGKADSLPFVKRVYKYALNGTYIVAQPIAVKWSPQQVVVWPTKSDGLPYVKRTTEQFVEEIIKAVRAQYRVNPRRISSMSWSSSGPAGYALSLQEDSPIVGSYIAMSVFKPDKLGPLTQARGHAYFIEHSLQDRICPLRMAEDAVRLLTAEGAKVKFNQYAGGHGWRGNVYPRIAAAIRWLEENAQPRSPVPEKTATR
jgi:predicted esterase